MIQATCMEYLDPFLMRKAKPAEAHAPIGKDTGFDKLKFEKQSYRTGWKRELHTQDLATKDMDTS